MSFESILQRIVNECGGGLGAVLMSDDGVPIAEASGSDGAPLSVEDIAAAGIEFGRILAEIGKTSDAIGGGGLVETVVTLDRFSLVFRCIDKELILVLAIAPDGNLGKARYLIRRELLAIREESDFEI